MSNKELKNPIEDSLSTGPTKSVQSNPLLDVSNNNLENQSFEVQLEELEKVLKKLEDGSTNLSDSLSQYEKGIFLLKNCYEILNKTEQQILILNQEGSGVTNTSVAPNLTPLNPKDRS